MLLAFLIKNSRDFVAKLDITLTTIIDKSTLLLEIKLEHRGNWADMIKMRQRRSRFMYALKEGMSLYGIEVAGGVDVNLFEMNGTPLSSLAKK